MNQLYRVSITCVSIGLGLISFVAYSQAMSTYQTTLAECQKRTGLSAGLCKSLVKNNLNVESCKKQTGLSEGECAKRIEEIKNDPEFSGRPASNPAPSSRPDDRFASPVDSVAEAREGGDTLSSWRAKKERELVELQGRTKVVIAFFKERGADVTDLEARFVEFEKKSDELLVTYSAFQSTYASTAGDPPAVRKALREEARGMITRARSALVEYYRSNILTLLLVAREQIL